MENAQLLWLLNVQIRTFSSVYLITWALEKLYNLDSKSISSNIKTGWYNQFDSPRLFIDIVLSHPTYSRFAMEKAITAETWHLH